VVPVSSFEASTAKHRSKAVAYTEYPSLLFEKRGPFLPVCAVSRLASHVHAGSLDLCEKGLGRQDANVSVVAQDQQVLVAGYDGVGLGSDGRGDDVIVVRVAADGIDLRQRFGNKVADLPQAGAPSLCFLIPVRTFEDANCAGSVRALRK